MCVKPIAEGSWKGVTQRSKVTRREDLRGRCAELIAAFDQPVLVETYLPGREITVGIVGNGGGARGVGAMGGNFARRGRRGFTTPLDTGETQERGSDERVGGDAL